MEAQNLAIRKYLERGNSITPLEALRTFGCLRLASRIYDLRKQGLNIEKKMVVRGRKTYASYKLITPTLF